MTYRCETHTWPGGGQIVPTCEGCKRHLMALGITELQWRMYGEQFSGPPKPDPNDLCRSEHYAETEQKGYEAFYSLYETQGTVPSLSQCPARYMKDETERLAYLRGWRRAREQHE